MEKPLFGIDAANNATDCGACQPINIKNMDGSTVHD
jgi:hypothetical protein